MLIVASLIYVTNLDPMNRGLKRVGVGVPVGVRVSYKPRPDE